jgi:hypothetical protein
MLKISISRRGRRAAIAAFAAGAMATGIVSATTTSANATPYPVGASGTVSVAFGGPAWAHLNDYGCGTPYIYSASGVSVFPDGRQIRVNFPITGVVFDSYGGERIDTSGTVTFVNYCYTITFTTLRVTNFGTGGQQEFFDVSATTHNSADGDSGRQVYFVMDFSTAIYSYPGPATYKVEKINLLTSYEGAEELNELQCGIYCYGTFVPYQNVGNARITVTFTY